MDFMRSNELPYNPLHSSQIDEELKASLAAVQRSKADFEGANVIEQGAKDQHLYEARMNLVQSCTGPGQVLGSKSSGIAVGTTSQPILLS